MKKIFIHISFLLIVIAILQVSPFAHAGFDRTEPGTDRYMTDDDIFNEDHVGTNLNRDMIEEPRFDDFYSMITEMAETVRFPHYLAENQQRYVDYILENPALQIDVAIAYVNAGFDKGRYADIQTVTNPDDINVMLNSNYALPTNWEPPDLININGWRLMRREAAEQFELMNEAMRKENLYLTIVSTYRSVNSQRRLFNNALASRGRTSAERSLARPGHSEHNAGLAIDVLQPGSGGSLSGSRFDRTKQYEWMKNNAHNYGFILRYPEEYTQLTGIIYEPWHWRYVGIPIAKAMYNEGITLYEEFYGRYLAPGIREQVTAFFVEQERLAKEARAAAIEAAAIEAAAIAEAEAHAAAMLAAQIEAIETMIITAVRTTVTEHELELLRINDSETEITAREAAIKNGYTGRFLLLLGILCAGVVYLIIRKNRKYRIFTRLFWRRLRIIIRRSIRRSARRSAQRCLQRSTRRSLQRNT